MVSLETTSYLGLLKIRATRQVRSVPLAQVSAAPLGSVMSGGAGSTICAQGSIRACG
jgi:hypothetical protein